jgi:aminopeptidase
MRRCLCQYPTQAGADDAGMTLEEYTQFVFQSCYLFDENPVEQWLNVRAKQQAYVDRLNKADQVHYKGPNIDIRFSVKDRIWINSDGRSNMPSGEVFSAPVEDSVNGKVYFSYPCIYMGKDVEGVSLEVKDGLIVSWNAEKGNEVLDKVFAIEGARKWGEVAIGTNMNIQRITRNILFDEKIGGSIHMAVGQAYKQCGGKNESTVHWDMITDMRNGGEIWADGELIYKDGAFII